MITSREMATMLLSDPKYKLPDNDSTPEPDKLQEQITKVYAGIIKIKGIFQDTPPEDIPKTVEYAKGYYPGFNKDLIPLALSKLEARLADIPLVAGGKSRKISKKNKNKSKSKRRRNRR